MRFLMVPSIILPLIIIGIISAIPTSEAAEQTYRGKAVGIIIETTVIKSGKLHYSDLVDLDTTDPKYMGKFVERNGDLVRQATSKQNNYRWLEFQKDFTIVVDPPLKFRTQLPIIIIVSQLDEFHIRGQDKVTEYKTTSDAKATQKIRSYSHTRYVDQTCTNAIITVKNWKTVLPDTINYLRSGCNPNHTQINTITNDVTDLIKHDLKTSYKWKDQQWRDQILKECTKSRNACTILPQPTRGGL